jgi:hypothetical protein
MAAHPNLDSTKSEVVVGKSLLQRQDKKILIRQLNHAENPIFRDFLAIPCCFTDLEGHAGLRKLPVALRREPTARPNTRRIHKARANEAQNKASRRCC